MSVNFRDIHGEDPHPAVVPADDPFDPGEIDLILEEIFEQTGYDFRDYAPGTIRRRLRHRMALEGFTSIDQFRAWLRRPGLPASAMVRSFSIGTSAMFRDPGFFRALRERVMPRLRTYPVIRIWVAGCSTGEEVYSLAILLREAGLESRARIYATDINEAALAAAREGLIPRNELPRYTANYHAAGGKHAFSNYYYLHGESARIDPTALQRVVFSVHNLATDGPFNHFQLILCRNVLIYFNRTLQSRVLTLFHNSLVPFGILGLGQKETLLFSPLEACYKAEDAGEKIFRKVHV